MRDIAYTLQTGRDAMDKRVIWTVGGVEELQDRLNDFCRGEDAPGSGIGGRNEADEMAASWARGERVDWNSLHSPDALPGRIPLPTYPFAEKSHSLAMGRGGCAGHGNFRPSGVARG